MLDNRARDNLLVPDRIAVTDLYRINDTFEQIKTIEGEIYSLFLTFLLKTLQDIDYDKPSDRWISESKHCKELVEEIRSESAYLIASYESLKEATKEFYQQPSGNCFISDMTKMKAGIDKVLKMVSLVY